MLKQKINQEQDRVKVNLRKMENAINDLKDLEQKMTDLRNLTNIQTKSYNEQIAEIDSSEKLLKNEIASLLKKIEHHKELRNKAKSKIYILYFVEFFRISQMTNILYG